MRTPVALDRRTRVPLHRQIYDQLRAGILAGRMSAGDRLPSTRECAAALRVSRATVTTAYDDLAAEGYLDGRRGSGTYVSPELPDRPLPPSRTAAGISDRVDVRLSRLVARLAPVPARPPIAPGVIDLSSSAPDDELFPFAVWNRLVRHQLRRGHGAGRHGTPDGAGYAPLREAIAAYLGRSRAVQCRAEQVVVVGGSQQALDLCARALVDRGDRVAVEEPCYPDVRQIFAAAGAAVRPVAVDADGLRVAGIPSSVRLVHVTPSHQYPTGVSLSLARRLELLAWARARQGFVIEDDYDSEFRYSGAPLPSLQGLSEIPRVLYVGTFSTATFAGLRLGYVVLPQALTEPFLRVKWYASRHTALLEQAALAGFIRDGHFERHIRRMRRIYKRRREALEDAVHRFARDHATVIGDSAGLHAVVRFDGPDVADRAGARGVALTSTRACYATAPRPNEFIVRFAGVSERLLREGIRRLMDGAVRTPLSRYVLSE